MSARYQYVKIGNRYFCLQQNPFTLVWFLYFRNEGSQPHLLKLSKKRLIRYLVAVIQHRLPLQKKGASLLELPVYGNLCLSVHRGYKVFNFHRNSVTKVFAPEIDQAAVFSEIERVRSAGLLDFAPSVRRWNIEQRWYEEDFVSGDLGYAIPHSEAQTLLEIYYRHVAPVIEDMILLKPPLTKNVGAYLDEMSGFLDEKQLCNPKLEIEKIKAIRRFAEAVVQQLLFNSDCQVDLVFSHGDFSFVNILSAEKGMIVIDWESAARRSMLNDFYNYFFTELYYQRVKTDLVVEINDAILSLQTRLNAKKSVGPGADLLSQIYRWFYYLERIQVLLERELSNKVLDVLMRSIEVFNHYEEMVGNKRFGVV